MQHPSSYPYQVAREDLRIPLPDGTELAARIWRPVTDVPVPVLLEYLADRLSDSTAQRDAQRHPWYAGHGYASVRVDARGHGNSGGLPAAGSGPRSGTRSGTPSAAQEQADGVAVLGWLTAQSWCNGRAGLFGIGPGGAGSLRIAALAPAAVQAVVVVCPDDDLPGPGGPDLPARAAALLAAVASPPDPGYVGDDWRRGWLERLAAVEPVLPHALSQLNQQHPHRHPGGVGADHDAVEAAVLAVGGWADPARDTVLRLVAGLKAPVRGLIGPWARQYPDAGLPPGPAIGFLQETLRWWDHWLKGIDTGVLREPALRSWMNCSVPPATGYANRPGRWIGEDDWPSPDVREIHYGLADSLRTAGTPSDERFVEVRSPQHTGIDAGRPRPLGHPADLPPDQREEDGRSVCFDAAPLPERLELLGHVGVRLRLRSDAPRGQVAARLCDVAPDGSSTLVTRGILDLAARHGRDRAVPWTPGDVEDVAFELAAIAHAFPPGHRIRLALSSAYWPWAWPQPGTSGFGVDPGNSVLTLPVRGPAADTGRPAITFDEPEQAAPPPPPPVHHGGPDGAARAGHLVVRDVAAGVWRVEIDPEPEPVHSHPGGLVRTEQARETYRIQQDDPLSAVARAERTVRFQRPDQGWDVTVRTSSELACEAGHFTAVSRLTAWEGGAVLLERDWEHRAPRP
ncbi:CocE/NonD family hydrolase [Kitasatospora mediocidica]|uniref:CocE/NonD family hydrolase n=1 Tax=Kitasatospora mediocidica TaxID=58352 RepID=UPI00056D6FCC|nr:CocE/NonD family hydrolase [Kitasatospora mediocidica]